MITSRSLEARATREPWIRDTISIRIAEIRHDGPTKTVSLASVTFTELSEQDFDKELVPTLSLLPGEAQQFMDELWRVGVRPTEGSGSVGQLAAVQSHLEDMRTLVFNPPKPS